MYYSILIPIYNEEKTLETLLDQLKYYAIKGHEIIIINDGSKDKSKTLLEKCQFIKLINIKNNSGKGNALRRALFQSKFNKTIIFDGDLEISTLDIIKLMSLNKKKVFSVMGVRSESLSFTKSNLDWGNFMFTLFFNLFFFTCHKDILCCAKSFYKSDIPIEKLKSKGFDIDIELASFISINQRGRKVKQVLLDYKRRSIESGKKLKISDGWIILKRFFLIIIKKI